MSHLPDTAVAVSDDAPKRVFINGQEVDVAELDVEVRLDSDTGEPVWEVSLTFATQRVATDCVYRGHEVTPDVRYLDGEIVGVCRCCGERITIRELPGGEPMARARAIVDYVVRNLRPDEDVEQLRHLYVLRTSIESDVAAGREALSMLETAERTLAHRILER